MVSASSDCRICLSRKQLFRQSLLETLEKREVCAGDTSLVRQFPAEISYSDDQIANYWSGAAQDKSAPFEIEISHDEIFDPQSKPKSDDLVSKVFSSVSDMVSLAIGMFNKKNGVDPDKPIEASTKSSYSTVSGGNKSDRLEVNHLRSTAMGGKSDDRIVLNAPYTTANGNQGNDTLVLNSQSSVANGGPGRDKYVISSSTRDNSIYDSSPVNDVILDAKFNEYKFGIQNKDLVVSRDGKSVVTIKNVDFRNQEFVVQTSDYKVGLSTLNRIPDQDAVLASIAAYRANRVVYEKRLANAGYALESRSTNDRTGLEMSIFRRTYSPGLTGDVSTDMVPVEGQYVVSIAGTQDKRDFAVFGLLPQLQANEAGANVERLIRDRGASAITITGHSGGGEVSLRIARDLAFAHPEVQFNVVMINSGGVSTLFADSYNLPNLSVTHYRYEMDVLSNPATNIARALTYPPQTETVFIPFDGTGPDFAKDPGGWVLYNHVAERILSAFEAQASTRSNRMLVGSTNSSSLNMPVDFTQLPKTVQDVILKATKVLTQWDAVLPATPTLERNFDFGTSTFVASGTIVVPAETTYSRGTGYGFLSSAQIRNGDAALGNDQQRDYVTGNSIPFQVDLPAGAYDVTLMTGNEVGLEYLTVLANSSTISTIYNTAPKEIKETTLRVQHPGGALLLEVRDTGGRSKNAVLNGLKVKQVSPWAPLPSTPISDPSLTVIIPGYVESVSIWDRLEASIEPVIKLAETVGALLTPAAPLKAFQLVSGLATIGQSSAKLYKAWANDTPDIPAWAITQQIVSNQQNARLGLPLQRIAFSDMSLTRLESMTNEEQQKIFKYTDVVIINAQKQLNDGVEPYGRFGDGVKDVGAYRKSIDRVSAQTFRVVANKARAIGLTDLSQKLDVQLISEDFAVVAAREAMDRIAREDRALAQKLGYVELVALNPLSVEQTDKLYVNFPEMRPFQFVVRSFWEDITDVPKGFVKGPLDREEGGNYLGVEAGVVREFSTADELGLKRFRNFSKIGKQVQGEVVGLSYHDSGLVALANAKGYLSVIDNVKDQRLFQDRVFKSKPIGLEFSPNGKNLAILNENGVLAIFNVATRNWTRVELKNGFDKGLHWLNDTRLVLAGSGGAIQSLTLSAEGRPGEPTLLGRIADKVTDFWLTPVVGNQQPRIVSVHEDRTIQVWGLNGNLQPQYVTKSPLADKQRILAVDTLLGNILIAQGSTAELIQITSNQLISKLVLTDAAKDATLTAGAFSRDGKLFVTGGDDQQLRFYDLSAALDRKRSLIKHYKSVMPEVRALELSNDGGTILASFKDANGGKTLDRNISEAVSKRISLKDKLIGDEYSIAKSLPTVFFEEYANTQDFHKRRNRADLDVLYGQKAKQGWKYAWPNAVDDAFADDDALLGDVVRNQLPPKFQRALTDMRIGGALTIDLRQLAIDPEGLPVVFAAKSTNSSIAQSIVVNDQLILTPVAEGSTLVTLTASDGLLETSMAFRVTTDGSLDRKRLEDLRSDFAAIAREQNQLRTAINASEDSVPNMRARVEKVEGDVQSYEQRLNRLQAELNSARTNLQTNRSTLANLSSNRNQVTDELRVAQQSEASANNNANQAASALAQARRIENARSDDFETAQRRFQNAPAAQRATRRSELNAARAAFDAATADRVAKLDALQSANAILDSVVRTRSSLQNRLGELNNQIKRVENAINDSVTAESNANRARDQQLALRTPLIAARDQLLSQLTQLQTVAERNSLTASNLASRLNALTTAAQTLRRETWVKELPLNKFEKEERDPAAKVQEGLDTRGTAALFTLTNLANRLRSVLK